MGSRGERRLPIHDAAHVRNALARFEQVAFESAAAKERARRRLLAAAARHAVAPVGFVTAQLRSERTSAEAAARSPRTARWPRGSVSFLMTDIEGSTRLVERLGDRYAAVLREVRAVHRDAVRAAGGVEIDARADEHFAAFGDAAAALGAARAVARGLAGRRWPGGARVRVRAGIHTGRAVPSDAGYVGLPVHTTARACAIGAGGDIVVTAAAREALGPAAAGLRRLGERRLEGLRRPVVLYRLRLR